MAKKTSPEQRRRILVIEDEKDLAEMIKIRLEKEGWQVELAYDGEEGIRRAKSLKPDLITLDIRMPKLDGYEVCRQLKADKECKHIPILMITVRASEQDKKLGYEAGADDYLPKPYERDVLVSKIKALLKE